MKHLIVFAGPNGSGKSTIMNQFIKNFNINDFKIVNPDIIAAKFFAGIIDVKQRYLKAFEFANLYLDELINHNEDIVLETVNSTNKYYKYYDKCKEQGYEITIIFVGTNDPEINVNRVLKRVAQGGHDVPKDKIKDRYYKSMNNLFTLACISDVLYIFDNSIDNSPRLCVYRDKNSGLKIINKTNWMQKYFIEKLDKLS